MTRLEFMQQLESRLSSIPRGEIDKSKLYFDEMINDRIEEGMSEEEAIEALGDPEKIAQGILSEMSIPRLVKAKVEKSHDNAQNKALWIVIAILGLPLWFPLALAFAMLVLSLYIVVWTLIISLYAIVAALGVSGIAGIGLAGVMCAVRGVPLGICILGLSLCMIAVTLFMIMPSIYMTKGLIRFTAFLMRKIKSLFIGKRGEQH